MLTSRARFILYWLVSQNSHLKDHFYQSFQTDFLILADLLECWRFGSAQRFRKQVLPKWLLCFYFKNDSISVIFHISLLIKISLKALLINHLNWIFLMILVFNSPLPGRLINHLLPGILIPSVFCSLLEREWLPGSL